MEQNGAKMGPKEKPNEAQMGPKWDQGGSKTCVLKQGAKMRFLCTVSGSLLGPIFVTQYHKKTRAENETNSDAPKMQN